MKTPRAILGTMTFGGGTTPDIARQMLEDFCCNSRWQKLVRDDPMVDSAIMYQNGNTEKIIGVIISSAGTRKDFPPASISIASKANPFTKDKDLSPEGVRNQLESTLMSLRRERTDVFYLHAPDVSNDIEETLEAVQKLYLKNKFTVFGLSNFSAWETMYIHGYMTRKRYVVPTVYQGMYNAITRQVESELFPCLRKIDMNFYAYNPLGGGQLTGKYEPSDENDDEAQAKLNTKHGNRFAGSTFWAKKYRQRFQQKKQFDALEIVRDTLNEINDNHQNDDHAKFISMAEASLRWLLHHSLLRENDGIIIGASRFSHYEDNMKSLLGGPLPDNLVDAFQRASDLCKDVCPEYSRGYSGSAIPK